MHGVPHDYYRYSPRAASMLARDVGLEVESVAAADGSFSCELLIAAQLGATLCPNPRGSAPALAGGDGSSGWRLHAGACKRARLDLKVSLRVGSRGSRI